MLKNPYNGPDERRAADAGLGQNVQGFFLHILDPSQVLPASVPSFGYDSFQFEAPSCSPFPRVCEFTVNQAPQ